MGRPRKLNLEQIQHAALDRQNGMSWQKLSKKYKCAVNTIRTALAAYSEEFVPIPSAQKASLKNQLSNAQSDIEKIKTALKKRFNLHV